jgi:hypothetical protein
MHIPTCPACRFARDEDDNFCRRCGVAVVDSTLPAVRQAGVLAVWRPQASPVMKGAAVMAAGTVGQFVFRRIIGGILAGSGGSARKHRAIRIKNPPNDGMLDEAQIITETIMMRRVRIRRQA